MMSLCASQAGPVLFILCFCLQILVVEIVTAMPSFMLLFQTDFVEEWWQYTLSSGLTLITAVYKSSAV